MNVAAARAWRILPLVVALLAGVACRRSRLPLRGDADPVVVLAEPADESGAPAVTEVEPNDTRAAAMPLALVGDPLSVRVAAALSSGKDVDVFRVTIPGSPAATADGGPSSGRRLFVELTPSVALSASLQLQDDSGQPLLTSVAAPGERHGIPNATVTPGSSYLLVVRAAQVTSARDYRLALRLLDFELGDEREPNDRAAQATLLAAADSSPEAAGFFGGRRDEDWFRVPLGANAAGVALEVELDAVPGVTASVTVLDEAESRMASARGRRNERIVLHNVVVPNVMPNVASTAPGSGRFCYVLVHSEGGRNLDQRYVLHVRSGAIKDDAETEPNDDPAHATLLHDGRIIGYLGAGEVDVFRVDVPEAEELRVDADPPDGVDLRLEIVSVDGKVIMTADAGRRHEAEHIVGLYAEPGAIFVRVKAAKGEGNVDEPYHLQVVARMPEPGSEREPNGTAATATALGTGETGVGLLYPRGDVDMWLVPIAEGPASIAVRGIPSARLEVRVTGRKGGADLLRLVVGPEGATRDIATAAQPADDGCCLVLIREISGKGANINDPYSLRLGP